MKIIILHQHFRTPERGGAVRSWYLARALADRGIETVVITAHNDPTDRAANLDGVMVHYLAVPYDNRFGFYRRVLSFLTFTFRAAAAIGRHRDADVCYAISTPLTTGLTAMWTRRRYGIPFFFEVGDLWPDAPVEMGFIRNRILKTLAFRMERRIYRRALAVVALSEPIRQRIVSRMPSTTVHVIPNMADTDFFRPALRPAEGKEIVIAYCGAVGVANGLRYFADAAAACEAAALPVRFILCGEGACLEFLRDYVRQKRLRNFAFERFRNREGVRHLLETTDINFVCYAPYRILETGSPNKYFDGLAAGKLTIVNFGGWIREEVEQHGCGFYVDPNDPQDLVRKLQPLVGNRQSLVAYQQAARRLAEQKYARPDLSTQFYELFAS